MIRNSSTSHLGMNRVHLPWLQVEVTPLTSAQLSTVITDAAFHGRSMLVGAHNLHSVYLYYSNPVFREFYSSAEVVLVDGWPIRFELNRMSARRGRKRYGHNYRIGSTDWIPPVLLSGRLSRVCVIGASSVSNLEFIRRYSSRVESTEFFGYPGDPWEESNLEDLIESVRKFDPDLTLVGMGMPLQEEVALSLSLREVGGVIATVGGAIDQLSGKQVNAPRWTGKLGIEWLWRLLSDPRRLAYRYLVEPLKLLRILRATGRRL